MYISELKLWNFRKYGKDNEWNLNNPDLTVPFQKGVNVLIGENDSGKSAIVDAIKLVVKTHAYEWIKVEKEDFYNNSEKLRIEILFDGFKDDEAKNFIEWLGWKGVGEDASPVLRLILQVEQKNDKILPYEVKSGMDETGHPLNAEAREYLKSTYLKALRDADTELIAKRNSRLSQILLGHELFNLPIDQHHTFEKLFSRVNKRVNAWFENNESVESGRSVNEQIKGVIDTFLHEFIDDNVNSELKLTDPDIKAVLEKIAIGIKDQKNVGLGSMNRLYMATELLHLKKEWDGMKLGIIEELEAHLHPQAQMKVIEALQKQNDIQFILTTHSPNLASKVDLSSLIICNKNDVFPLSEENTKLENENYAYLKRFLDVTKSNLFFAKGIILVEGWSEEILIPEIAKKIGFDLSKHEVSIVNVGSIAYLHFAKIFLRNDDKVLQIPVSVITDLDIRPNTEGIFDENKEKAKQESLETNFKEFKDTNVNLEVAKRWTLEWCLYKSPSLSNLFMESVSKIHSNTDEFKKDGDRFKPEFEVKFIRKLSKSKGLSPIDKVAIAGVLAEKISTEEKPLIKDNDEYLEYIVRSIKHACGQ